MKYIVGFLRIFVGIFFIISGFIKLNDPIGFAFKLEEYFGPTVLDLPFFIPYALGISIIVVVFEVLLGIFLIIGYKPKFTVWSLLLMIIFFTFLTFYSAYFDKVKDCGCFGDAMKMDPWESFWKDVALLVMILIIFFGIKHIKPFFGKLSTTILSLLSFIACLGFAYHVLMHLPSIDFRPFKVGNNITDKMIVPEGAPQPVIEYTWIFDENGTEKAYMTSGSYPESTGTYVGVTTETISEGYEPPIHDFSIEKDGEDFTQDILTRPHVVLIVNYNLALSEAKGLEAIKIASDLAIANGYDVIGLTASGPDKVALIKSQYKLGFDYYFCDETALKTIIRSNPGVLKLEKGTIIQKLHWNDVDQLALPKVERPTPKVIEEVVAYFIDDTLVTKAETEALDPETIERMDVFKDRTQLDSLNIDSEKNITGVVKITLKKE
ncbi:BT_3928 family protein [Olleya sp. Bg11-27]|uniref:BT_3928 family protein n=1 Tax=Olleya sp. Bg11-27 TaxID=2058135 RepID=UPI000C310C00|nr:BT_3928 family protein [Olleya sp. Bg11-27]AUC77393.1 DoxX family protein [Olleya sp. Bg11-27]